MQWLLRSTLLLVVAGLALSAYGFSHFQPARPMVGKSGVVPVEGRRVGYALTGQGPTVVLLASAGRSASDFNELIAALDAAGYRSLAIEAPAAGRSDPLEDPEVSLHVLAGDVAAVLDVVGPDPETPVFLLGHAFGNRVARAFATDFPGRVRAMMLLASGGRVPPEIDVEEAFQTIFSSPPLPDAQRIPVIQEAFFAGDNRVPDYWVGGWHPLTLLTQTRATTQTPIESWWDGGSAPILILQPRDDVLAPPGNAELLRRAFPERVRVIEIPEAGHALLPEQPKILARVIVDYLDAYTQED
jgi:pimeloyl-ACP methyl ester carboxylesterase